MLYRSVQPSVLISEPHIFGATARYGGHQYARVFARNGWKVILLSASFNYWRLYLRKEANDTQVDLAYIDLWREHGRVVEQNIANYVPAHVLPTKIRYTRPFSYVAHHLYAPSIRSILKSEDIEQVDLLWLNGNQDWLLAKAVPYRKMVMRIIDDYSGFRGGHNNYHRLMRETMLRSNGVFACTEQVSRVFSKLHNDIHVIPNGADFEHFSQVVAQDPEEMSSIPHPRVTYVGAIAEWFDFELVAELAKRLSEYQFVLFGGWSVEKPDAGTYPSNIHILGPLPYERVPHVLANSDIGLVPFKDTELVRGVSPIKVYEYLAARLPVVSLAWQELERESLPIYLARNVDDFECGIRKSLAMTSDERDELRDSVRDFSWEHRLEDLLGHVGMSLYQETDGTHRPL